MYGSHDIWVGTSCILVTKFGSVLHACQSRNLGGYFMCASHETSVGTLFVPVTKF